MSRISSSSNTQRPKWNPQEVLDLYPESRDFTCAGKAQTGKRCKNRIAASTRSTASSILIEIALLYPDPIAMKSKLKMVASTTLCLQWHREGRLSQVDSLTSILQSSIKDYRDSLPLTVPIIQRPSTPQRSQRSPSSSSIVASNNKADRDKIANLLCSIYLRALSESTGDEVFYDAAIQEFEQAKATIDLLATHLRQCSRDRSRIRSRRTTEQRNATQDRDPMLSLPEVSSSSPPSTTPSVWSSNSSSLPSPPSSPLSGFTSRQQRSGAVIPSTPTTPPTPSSISGFTPATTASTSSSSSASASSASTDTTSRRPQVRSVTSSGLPSIDTTSATTKHRTRKPLTDPCCICTESITRPDDAVWCRAACGQNFHRECFSEWERTQLQKDRTVNCVFCRATWE